MTKHYFELKSGTIIQIDDPSIVSSWRDAKKLAPKEGRARLLAEQTEKLREWFPRGATVYTILRHVSRSGMQRKISVVGISDDKHILHPNFAVATVLDRQRDKQTDAIVCNGAGDGYGVRPCVLAVMCALRR